ncbi:MAG TPA: bifunctional YncE family protein/alkaline phosphatase family protein [Verrucomicrobiae bacterium]|nr:bifunctional YncE family protein/alkaline phosphatase family protein [Verrucomicrobiae bacterium]
MTCPLPFRKGFAAHRVLALLLLSPVLLRAELPDTGPVAQTGPDEWMTPVNQRLTPVGRFVSLPGFRPQALALSPNGRLLVTTGKKSELLVLNPASGQILQHVALPSDQANEVPDAVSANILEPDQDGQLSYTGLIFSPDGKRLYLANVNGSVKVFTVAKDGKISGRFSMPLPPANVPRRKNEIPAGLALSADGSRLYVCGNLSNRLFELDAASGQVLRTWDVGVAPYDVVLVGHKAYVSNWGGRRPGPGDLTGPAGRGTVVRVDPVRSIASEGSVSVIELSAERGMQNAELLVGLHASALAVSPNRRHLVVANAGSDTLSVIDTRTDQIVETIWARQNPGDLFGAQPNALAFDKSGRRLFVCNGTQNAVAVIAFKPGKSEWQGLIPVGWFPGAIVFDARRDQLCVANIKGLPARPMQARRAPGVGFNTHQYTGSLSLVPVPAKWGLRKYTGIALANMRYPRLRQAALPARPGQPPRPVPERVGEPGVFRHVVYIIKENRTYDQVLGDDLRGNGDPSLCIFGERVTPNQHQIVREFALLDNTYCSGILSADGHQWATTAMATDYMEKSFAGFPRSYPDGAGEDDVDALAYSPAGFIWDNLLAHGRSLRVFGEFCFTQARWADPTRKGRIHFRDHWEDFTKGTNTVRRWSEAGIASLQPYIVTNTAGWDLKIPDVWRAQQFIANLQECERNGSLPAFTILYLPNDHTSGTGVGQPTPAAQVADNDLAMGQVIEALSHSSFWSNTVVFAMEDDPQDGWDHVSGYRSTAYVASPYTKRGAVIHTRYNQTSLIRTMELILGLPPMNQLDATATPMADCFTDVPDFAPFTAVTNQVPLDEMNPDPKKVADAQLRRDALVSARLPLTEPDQCPEDTLNRILWRAMKGPQTPYPEWAVKLVGDDD